MGNEACFSSTLQIHTPYNKSWQTPPEAHAKLCTLFLYPSLWANIEYNRTSIRYLASWDLHFYKIIFGHTAITGTGITVVGKLLISLGSRNLSVPQKWWQQYISTQAQTLLPPSHPEQEKRAMLPQFPWLLLHAGQGPRDTCYRAGLPLGSLTPIATLLSSGGTLQVHFHVNSYSAAFAARHETASV